MNAKTIARTGLLAVVALATALSVTAQPSQARGRFAQRHPRRAEVLNRDGNLNRRINNDRGDLGGHYGQLKREDRSIRRQEQRDARQNGGHITKGEQHQLNREENRVNRQINRDQR